MWIFCRYGFYSVTVLRNGDTYLRARSKNHLQRLRTRFPQLQQHTQLEHTPKRDYPWRQRVPALWWANMLRDLALEQDWSNFKDEAGRCHGKSSKYARTLHQIWSLCFDFTDEGPDQDLPPVAQLAEKWKKSRSNRFTLKPGESKTFRILPPKSE